MSTKSISINVNSGVKDFGGIPERCPECHNVITPEAKGHYQPDILQYYVMFKCPSSTCGVCFTYYFKYDVTFGEYRFVKMIKGTPIKSKFSKHIFELSPTFCGVFNESEEAENFGLMEICGVGYRKALEFLVKDYLILRNPSKEEDIKRQLLGACISQYVKNENIKQTSKRAAWLGNDETHYIRKWQDKDLKDLKLLINLTINWIEMELLTEELILDMPE